ncbi:MAG: site-specific integrase [Chromatiales bacterium]|nr:site-specific integrase [Chromatiales bacterium]
MDLQKTDTLPADDRDRVRSAIGAARAPNTRAAYEKHWRYFADWCAPRRDLDTPLGATPVVVAAYLAERATRCRTSTVKLSAAAIGSAFRAANLSDPTRTAVVRDTLSGIARQHAQHPGAAPRQARALEYAAAVQLLATAEQPRPRGRGTESPTTARKRAVLDKAIVALLFCAGLRRSEASAVTWSDVDDAQRPANALRIRIRASKTNPDGSLEDHRLLVGPFAQAIRDLQAAKPNRSPTDRIVPLAGAQISRRLAALGRHAGIHGLSGHSGRHGLATELVRRGASTTAVQAAGGWRRPDMVARYASRIDIEDGAVARYLT